MEISIHRDVEILAGRATLLTVTKITGLQVVYFGGRAVEVDSVTITDGWGSCVSDCTRARKNLTPEAGKRLVHRTQEIAAAALMEQEP